MASSTVPLRLALATLLCAPLLSCHTGSSNTLAGAAVMTTLAGGFSAARRANGECYVDCLPGTRCNRINGLCEALPCRDRCGPGETCSETETGLACMPAGGMNVQTNKGAVVPRTGPAEKEAPQKDGEKPAAPSAAVQSAPAPAQPATPKAEGERQGPTPGILPLQDSNTPRENQSLIQGPGTPPPR